jgi:hypothetical protein
MNARVSVTAAGLASRLRHAGIDVAEEPEQQSQRPSVSSAYTVVQEAPEVYLSNGLRVTGESDGYHVEIPHGPDPICYDIYARERELGFCENVFDLPELIRSIEPAVPQAQQALLGENRDVVGEMQRIVTDLEAPLRVVGSNRPEPGALAVAIVGKRFTAWYQGTRFTSCDHLARMLLNDSSYRPVNFDEFIPLDVDAHHLTLRVNGLSDCFISGTVRTSGGDEWFQAGFNRWTSWSKRANTRSVGGVVSPGERASIIHGVTRGLDRAFVQHFGAFAHAEVVNCERELLETRSQAALTQDRDQRNHWLRRERAAMQLVADAQQIVQLGRVPALDLDRPYRFGPVAVQ